MVKMGVAGLVFELWTLEAEIKGGFASHAVAMVASFCPKNDNDVFTDHWVVF